MVKKALFVSTIKLQKNAGGVRYSKSILASIPDDFSVDVIFLEDCQYIRWVGLRYLMAVIASIFLRVPPNILMHSGFINIPKEFLEKKWDVLFIDHLEAFCVIKKFNFAKSVYIAHNIESDLMWQKMYKLPIFFRNFYKNWLKKYEIFAIKSVSSVITISSLERDWYAMYNSNVYLVYPVFESRSHKFIANNFDRVRFGFLGAADWMPNYKAVELIFDKIIPDVSVPSKFEIVGSGWSEVFLKSFGAFRVPENVQINCRGYVSDIDEFWDSIDILVAPILHGSGVNVKICEALVNNVYVVALPFAVRGLNDNILNCGGIFVSELIGELAEAINSYQPDCRYYAPPEEFFVDYSKRMVDMALR